MRSRRSKDTRELLERAEQNVNRAISRRASTQQNLRATRESIARIKSNGKSAFKK